MRTDKLHIYIYIVSTILVLSMLYRIMKVNTENTLFVEKKDEYYKETAHNTILEENLYLEYERYVTTLQTNCNNISRCGPKGDTGYDICVDPLYKPKRPCLVYSFGSHYHFEFEDGVHKMFNCQIHTFDPSIPLAGHSIPKHVEFHLIGLSNFDHHTIFGWEMKTLASIRRYLNHSFTTLDILKLDIEGDEWKAIPQILSTISNKYIKQIVLEVHFGRHTNKLKDDGYRRFNLNNWGDTDSFTQINVLKQLKHHGFNIFKWAINPRSKLRLQHSSKGSVFTMHIISLKNINVLN
ncbi:probable methyltransferase-like protein 24 [Ruditapes philippinarum]|uniref:probable methyltransferase-like protein 24 n=1 Tax=Ruditapes philippinarum TaxID=129788 RepID=UPI00295A8DB2|nr:probable methyltransferase-like protein 24 [Ruditapes philippinarum]